MRPARRDLAHRGRALQPERAPPASVVPAMAVEKRPGAAYVPLADERAARTVGVVTLYGRSPTRANEAFLAHLGATS
jgi:hypothetical protein